VEANFGSQILQTNRYYYSKFGIIVQSSKVKLNRKSRIQTHNDLRKESVRYELSLVLRSPTMPSKLITTEIVFCT